MFIEKWIVIVLSIVYVIMSIGIVLYIMGLEADVAKGKMDLRCSHKANRYLTSVIYCKELEIEMLKTQKYWIK